MELANILEQELAGGKLALPPLPAVAQRVLALASDEDASSAALANLVHRDAGLASAVLRTANSASLGGATQISSLQQAVTRLGMAEVSRIAFAASMREDIFACSDYAAAVEQVWRRSLATGLFAKEVARCLRLNVEVAFLCGLLWRVGQPLALNGLPQVCRGKSLPDESDAIALAHHVDGAFTTTAAQRWELPAPVRSALGDRLEDGERCQEACIASVAERLADAALAEKDAEEAFEIEPNQDSASLNLYPENLEELLSNAATVRDEIASMP